MKRLGTGRQCQTIGKPEMKYAILILITLFMLAGASMGYMMGNDFVLYLFGLLAFAPVTIFWVSRSWCREQDAASAERLT